AVRSWTRCSSSSCAFFSCVSAHLLLASERRFASPRVIIKPEKIRNPTIPEIAVSGSWRAKELKGGRKYQTPTTDSKAVTMEAPRPQYQAEKTTAIHAV